MKQKFTRSELILLSLLIVALGLFLLEATKPPMKEPYFPIEESSLQTVARKYYNRCVAASVHRGEDPATEIIKICEGIGDVWCASLGYKPIIIFRADIFYQLDESDDGGFCISLLDKQMWSIVRKVSETSSNKPYIDDFGPLE